MAGEHPTQTIFIQDLATKSVTLYPSRAHVVRDIDNVLLKPGVNEIEIFGLSPTIDEHSVQIDGKGAATILDMTIELVPNRDIFEEVYPDDEREEPSDEEGRLYEDSDDEPEFVKVIANEIKVLKLESKRQAEIQRSATQRLGAIDHFLHSVSVEHNNLEGLHQILKGYEKERGRIFNTLEVSEGVAEAINKKLRRKENEKLRASKDARNLKEKERQQKEIKKMEKRKAAKYKKDERLRYWPKKVYRILLQLETNTTYTPSSSRRNSMNSVTLTQFPVALASKNGDHTEGEVQLTETAISLSLFYVTREAAWTPRYDIKANSVNKTALIVYRTEFINHTSETWRDTKISFSTSQTSYQGLEDTVPQLHPWHVKLTKGSPEYDSGLLSLEETSQPRGSRRFTPLFDRQKYFGMENRYIAPDLKGGFKGQANRSGANHDMSGPPGIQVQSQPQGPTPPSIGMNYPNLTDTSNHALQDYHVQLMLLEQQNKKRLLMARQEQEEAQTTATTAALIGQSPLGVNDLNPEVDSRDALEFSESAWEDNGLTATYEIPQMRTLPPSSQTRRYKIASLNATNINLFHTAVPKLRSAAFLLAKIKNPSSNLTLLSGSAGVTLDGSFLGNTTLPRVSPNQIFQLSFGVDPDIHIAYPKPSVKRSLQGLFTKECTQVYMRNVWLTNSKTVPVDLIVLEQVPISEDDRLKVDITFPRGLIKEGDTANAGIPAREAVAGNIISASGGKQTQSGKWGSALARLKKNGEVSFTARLEPLSGCLLNLEYETRLPSSDIIVPA